MKNKSSKQAPKKALRKTDVRRSAYQCANCSTGVVEVIQKDTKQHSTIDEHVALAKDFANAAVKALR